MLDDECSDVFIIQMLLRLKKEAKDRDKRREARRKKIAKENNLLYIKK